MKKDVRFFDLRYRLIVGFIVILMLILGVRLFVLAVAENGRWTEEASQQSTKTITTSAPRGNIYDRNGELLAGNRQIFNVTFNASSLTTEEINDSALTAVNRLLENGDEVVDDFAIEIDEDGNFSYTYDEDEKEWLRKNGYDTEITAYQLFSMTCAEYNIDDSDRYKAMDTLTEKYGVSLPITVRTMEYVYQTQKKNFWSKFGFTEKEIDEGMTAEECFDKLREKYKVDEDLSDSEARKIFIIRDQVANNGYTRYIPFTIAKDVSKESVIYFEESAVKGVSVTTGTERTYPEDNTACHVLGYMGAISESEADSYTSEDGYTSTDLIGKDGIEAAYESYLHGIPGVKTIRVNSAGEEVATISETEPEKGQDIYLTIDLDLQKTAETSLEKAIKGSEHSGSGAAVAVDVKTGEVLAMASYPDFDLNMFADGISTSEWESVQAENPRDALSPAPLYNNATMTSVSPGSTFKPITALTALKCGLDPYRQIQDRGRIEYGGRTFGCSAWNEYGGTHGSENLEWGIGNSCNYYFYCIATDKDWGTGESLGYTEDIDVDKMLEAASQFGLGEASGIEIYETVMPIATADTKMANYRYGAWNAIYDNASTYFPEEVTADYDRLSENITTIADYIYDNPDYQDLIDLIRENTEVKDDQVENVASMVKFDYFNQAEWTTGDVFNTAIGQGLNAYTPVQMARYIATLGNKGIRNELTLIKSVGGEEKSKASEAVDIGIPESDWKEVIKGMKRVTTSGTLSGVYGSSYPVSVAAKTGTAENQGIKQPADEVEYVKNHLSSFNSAAGTDVTWSQIEKKMKELMLDDPAKYSTENDAVDQALIEVSDYKINQSMINSEKDTYDYFSWTVVLAPADDPEIAVVVMLVEGGWSTTAAPVTKDILNAYFDL